MDSPYLGRAVRKSLIEADAIFVSSASIYEIALKYKLGKLPEVADLLADFTGHLASQDFTELMISHRHGLHAGALPIDHKDPFDRMLIAQAQLEGLSLVSNERLFDRFGVNRIWD